MKDDHKSMLLSATTAEFIQIKEIKFDQTTSKRMMDIVRTCQAPEGCLEEGLPFKTPYFLLSEFQLPRNVF